MVIVAFFAVADFVDFDVVVVVVVVVVNVSNGSKTVVAQWLPNIGKLANKLLPLLQLLIHLLPRQQGHHVIMVIKVTLVTLVTIVIMAIMVIRAQWVVFCSISDGY